MSQEQIAQRLGVQPSAVSAWQRGGRIHWLTADIVAVRLGTHPAEVWGDDWTEVQSPELTETRTDSV
jgi:transcriptional regulator with XRE-family HTH domain